MQSFAARQLLSRQLQLFESSVLMQLLAVRSQLPLPIASSNRATHTAVWATQLLCWCCA